MNSQLINGIIIDWSKIEEGSYLRQIDALKGLDTLTFDHPITFFAGENGSGKSTLLEAIAIADGFNPEGEQEIIIFRHMIHTLLFAMPQDSYEESDAVNGDTF